MQKIALFLSLLVGSFSALNAEDIYLLFDASCMQRLEFDHQRIDGRGQYVMYHVNIRSGEKLVLEVGEEGTNWQNYMPSPVRSCATGGFDQGLMRRINSNLDRVFMVYSGNNGNFILTQIRSAAYYTKQGNVVTYESPKYRLRFDLDYGTIGENIAYNNPGAKLYFEGRVENGCNGAYLFRQLSPQSAFPLIDLALVPELGIVDERSGANATAAQSNAMQLSRVNGIPASTFLQSICGTEPGASGAIAGAATSGATAPSDYFNPTPNTATTPGNLPPGAIIPGGQAVRTPVNTGTVSATGSVPANTQPAATAGTHSVVTGETLYGISKKYNVSVEQLKAWNNLPDNNIRRGQVLVVSQPTNTFVSPTPNYQSGTAQVNRSPGTTLSGSPVPYDQTGGSIATADSKTHIVRPGETVASIALQYGYTTQKFREINDLGPNDVAKVGQRLKTTDCDCAQLNQRTGTSTNAVPTNATSVPSSLPQGYESSSNRLSPNQFQERTPAQTTTSQALVTGTSLTQVRPSGGLSANAATSRDPIYDAVVPAAYEYTAPVKSPAATLTSYESTGSYNSSPRVDDSYSRPVVPGSNTNAIPSSYDDDVWMSPSNSDYTAVRRPDSYYTPATSNQRKAHIVQDGETLYSISRQYGTTVDQLRKINNLDGAAVIIPYQTIYVQ